MTVRKVYYEVKVTFEREVSAQHLPIEEVITTTTEIVEDLIEDLLRQRNCTIVRAKVTTARLV